MLRIEDTDKERSKKEYEENILEGLKWLGLDWDREIVRQSERSEVYRKYLQKLLNEKKAYLAEENKDGSGQVIRFKNPNETVNFKDVLRGEISVDSSDLGDFVIAKDMENPLYHLAVVVDDYESGVNFILRGEDGLSNTPRQILLQEALGFNIPKYLHIPFTLGKDKSKLSKRHGAKSVLEYKQEGYIPEAVVNFLALLGWREKGNDEKEIWTMDELLRAFRAEDLQKSPAVFDEEKLRWVNKEHLKKVGEKEFKNEILNFTSEKLQSALLKDNSRALNALAGDLRDRISVYSDIKTLESEGEFDWLVEDTLDYLSENLIWKKSNLKDTVQHLKNLIQILCDTKNTYLDPSEVEESVMPYAEEKGKGDVLWPMRYALSGQKRSANPFILFAALGPNAACARLQKAVEILQEAGA